MTCYLIAMDGGNVGFAGAKTGHGGHPSGTHWCGVKNFSPKFI
jgi:hypothetical protein